MVYEDDHIKQLNDEELAILESLIRMPTIVLNHEEVLFVNQAFRAAFDTDRERLNRKGIEAYISDEYKDRVNYFIEAAMHNHLTREQGEVCIITKADGQFWVEHKSQIVSYKGKTYILSHLLDINDKKKTQTHLSKLLTLRESMLEVTQSIVQSDGITKLYAVILNSVVKAVGHSRLGTVLLREGEYLRPVAQIGFEAESIRNFKLHVEDLFLYRSVGPQMDQIAKVDDLRVFGDYYKISTNSGEHDYIRSTLSAPIYIKGNFFGVINVDSTTVNAFDDDDVKLMEFVRNNVEIAITNQLLYEEKAYLSRFDSLTRLYNRHYFDEVYEHIKERASRYGEKFNLVVFDLNDLKRINDEQGHMAGDTILRYFADSCKMLMRKSDILARYGGDEFVGIFYNCGQDKLRKRIDSHLKQLSENPIHLGKKTFTCSYSYGIASFGDEGVTLNELFKVADDRMYENKIRYKLGFDFISAFDLGET